MKNKFQIWSKTNPDSLQNICPDLGLREWAILDSVDLHKIWKHFINKGWFKKTRDIYYTIDSLNEKYKRKSYGSNLLEHGGPHLESKFHINKYVNVLKDCCLNVALIDFNQIFLSEEQDVVYELLSIYAFFLIDHSKLNIDENEDSRRLIEDAYNKFNEFQVDFNDIFEQFNLNVTLTRNGMVFRQDKKITDDIYQPVLNYLSGKKWNVVNRDLRDAFTGFQLKKPKGYSDCITHTVSALEGFLQIIVNGKTGKGHINRLILQAQKKDLIPNDLFTKKIFKDIESILMAERKKTGNPHPKKEYANEKNAKLLLNLTMIFIQHCILN